MTEANTDTPAEAGWRVLYAIGAVTALAILAGTVFDIVLTMLPGWGLSTVPADAPGWFAQFAATPLLALRNLDLLNVVMSLAGLPMYLAVLAALRREQPGLAAVAVVFVCAGAVLFAANCAALPMLELSRRYAAAGVSERAALEAAAHALLARGAHGSFGAFMGFIVSEVGTVLTGLAMVRGRVFGRIAGWIAVVGAAGLAVYSVAFTFFPGSAGVVTAVAVPCGLLMLAWYAMVSRALFRLSRDRSEVAGAGSARERAVAAAAS